MCLRKVPDHAVVIILLHHGAVQKFSKLIKKSFSKITVAKGQSISEWIYIVIVSPKIRTKIVRISALCSEIVWPLLGLLIRLYLFL